jgi:hypothetical protein
MTGLDPLPGLELARQGRQMRLKAVLSKRRICPLEQTEEGTSHPSEAQSAGYDE